MDILAAEFFVEASCVFSSQAHSDNCFRRVRGPDDCAMFEQSNLLSMDEYTEPVAYNNVHNDVTAVSSPRQVPSISSEYANCVQMHRANRSQHEEEFFQHTGSSLEATVDRLNELFQHFASRLHGRVGDAAGSWSDRLIAYWNELGIDQSTINSSLQVHHSS